MWFFVQQPEEANPPFSHLLDPEAHLPIPALPSAKRLHELRVQVRLSVVLDPRQAPNFRYQSAKSEVQTLRVSIRNLNPNLTE